MLQIAARNLWRRKSRSLLAILALVIGILAIVLLISLTAGLKASYTEIMSGINGVWVMEKGTVDQTLSKLDADYGKKIEAIPGVRVALPEVWPIIKKIDKSKAEGGGMTMGMVMGLGLDPEKERYRVGNPYGAELLRGRMMEPGDKEVAVLGSELADTYDKVVGSTIDVDGKKLKVIGIFGGSDIIESVIAMPIDDAQELAGLDSDTVQDFIVQLNDPENEDKIAQTIRFKWPDKLDTYTVSELSGMMDEVLGVIDQFFIIIVAIALVIAGVGIVNTMLIAVKERMKEFGVLRAMGWTQEDVLRLVVTESVMLGLVGGLVGVGLGYALTALLSTVLPFNLVVNPELAIGAFVFSGIAGLVGGVYPAWKASKMDPIQAIRGEA